LISDDLLDDLVPSVYEAFLSHGLYHWTAGRSDLKKNLENTHKTFSK